MINVYNYLKEALPQDNAKQSSGAAVVTRRVSEGHMSSNVLDLGCGVGRSIDLFRKILPDAKWVGVDIEHSPEVNARSRQDAEFLTYDGVNLPFPDNHFGVVYSHQVFEHVRYPEPLLSEIKRVLTDDGIFVGQTSHLEPYHSYSIFNYTPYGWKVICETAGLELIELRPGIDSISLIKRSFLGRPPEFDRWFVSESPLNREIEIQAEQQSLSHSVRNFRKLQYSGQFVFVCRRHKDYVKP